MSGRRFPYCRFDRKHFILSFLEREPNTDVEYLLWTEATLGSCYGSFPAELCIIKNDCCVFPTAESIAIHECIFNITMPSNCMALDLVFLNVM